MTITYNSNYKETRPFSDTCAQMSFIPGFVENYVVPGTPEMQYEVVFEYACNSNVFVTINGTPAFPAPGVITSQPYCEFKPKKKYAKGGDLISLVTPDATGYAGLSLSRI